MLQRIGVVGVGVMGHEEARILDSQISGATVTAVADFDLDRARGVAAELRGATAMSDGFALIASDEVDAVVVAARDDTHVDLVLAAIAAGKPVMCEKPLAPTAQECRRVVEAQADRGGRDLVGVGFMRRFDPSYVELKHRVDSGHLGVPLVAHCVSRTVDTYPGGDSASSITSSAIHELDVVPWLLSSPIVEVTWVAGRSSARSGIRVDPQIYLLRNASDVVVTVELFLNAGYGYDTRCEVVGENGTAAMTLPTLVIGDEDRTRRVDYPRDWIPRYRDAYRIELQEWIDSIRDDRVSTLATAADGLRAAVVADALIASMRAGGRVTRVDPDGS